MRNIVFARIDDRLIHGQVMTAWVKFCQANEILIIDNEVSKDNFVVMMMKSLVPKHIKLRVLNEEQAVSFLKEEAQDEKILILVKFPEVILTLVDQGIALPFLNVGGMGTRGERTKLFKNIAASVSERETFKKLLGTGLSIKVQVVPTEKETDLSKYID